MRNRDKARPPARQTLAHPEAGSERPVEDEVAYLLADVQRFSRQVIGMELRPYQAAPVQAIIRALLRGDGGEFLLVFPRQSGKNEAVAHLLVHLLNLYSDSGGEIVYTAGSATLDVGVRRLEARLENRWNAGGWRKHAGPGRRCLGRACVVFLSSEPAANVRGHTAGRLLVVDEAQEQDAAHMEAVFTPMRAASNAPALYVGTVKTTTDYLWQKKLELEAQQARDGTQRVYLVTPEEVCRSNPAYRLFLDAQVARHGRHHPIVASEYFLEPADGAGGLFDGRRLRLMQGGHPRQAAPLPGETYVATLDVAGEDEAATDPLARLQNPARDYTVATVFQVLWPRPGRYAPGPTYRAVDVFVDHGSKHFGSDDGPQAAGPGPSLADRLLGWLERWQVAHLVADESGVGLGLVSWLRGAMGEARVTGFAFTAAAKAALGCAFLALVETGRFLYWTLEVGSWKLEDGSGNGEDGSLQPPISNPQPLSDAWWFFRQAAACAYEVPPGSPFDRGLRWGVPAAHRTDTPAGPVPTHDDRLLSAALVAELDRLIRSGAVRLGAARSAVVAAPDPLAGNVY